MTIPTKATCAGLATLALLAAAGSAEALTPFGYVDGSLQMNASLDVGSGETEMMFYSPAQVTGSDFDAIWSLFFREFADVGDYDVGIDGQLGEGNIHFYRTNPHGFVARFDMPLSYSTHSCCVYSYVDGVGDVLTGYTDEYDYNVEQAFFDASFAEGSEGQPYYVAFSGVPEPRAWLLVIVGLGLVGTALRRRAQKTAAA